MTIATIFVLSPMIALVFVTLVERHKVAEIKRRDKSFAR